MSAYVLMNLLKELRKSDKMRSIMTAVQFNPGFIVCIFFIVCIITGYC